MNEVEVWAETDDRAFNTWLRKQTYRSDIIGYFAERWMVEGSPERSADEWIAHCGGSASSDYLVWAKAREQFNAVHPDPAFRLPIRTVLSAKVPRHVPESRKISAGMRAFVLERDGFRCRRCGNGSRDGARLVVDHIVAVAKGGSKDHGNLQTLCFDCNAGKSDRDPHPHDLRRR